MGIADHGSEIGELVRLTALGVLFFSTGDGWLSVTDKGLRQLVTLALGVCPVQPFPLEVVLSPKADSIMEDESFLSELWDGELRLYFLHFLSDFVKTLSILAALYVFWEAIALLRFRGYPDNLCQNLEKTHFAFMWVALCATGANFVGKQVFAIWRKK